MQPDDARSNSPSSESDAAANSLPPVEMQQRLDFFGWTNEDRARLARMAPEVDKHSAQFVADFYEHLFRFAETSRFLRDPERVARLRQLQQQHFTSLMSAQWEDTEFVERRRAVGQAHAEIGLEPQWYIGSYMRYVDHCFRLLSTQPLPSIDDACHAASSLMKAILMDIDLALDAYFYQSTRKLQSALEMYLRSNMQLRRFAQLTSHDLKTPLATVANLCEETLDEFGDQLPPEAAKLIAGARQGVFRMNTLINELLETTIAPESTESNDLVALGEVLHEAIDRVRPILQEKHIEVTLPASFPEVWGNRVRLREAFYNLLSNAAKFMDKQPGRVEVRVESSDAECQVSVRDNGPGIPEAELERVFIPFRRLPAHRDQPGSGLGLYFAKSLIEEQAGKIWAESTVGAGTTFHVQLPRHAPPRPRIS